MLDQIDGKPASRSPLCRSWWNRDKRLRGLMAEHPKLRKPPDPRSLVKVIFLGTIETACIPTVGFSCVPEASPCQRGWC